MGKRVRREWQPWEDEFLHKNYNDMTNKQLSEQLNRSIPSINGRALKLGLREPKPPKWDEDRIEYLKKNWHRKSIKALAKDLERSEGGIKVKAKRLKLGPQLDPYKFTAQELAYIMDKDIHVILRWIEQGYLKAQKSSHRNRLIYQINCKSLVSFLREYPEKWDASRCPDIHLDIKRKEYFGDNLLRKTWGKKEPKKWLPEELHPELMEFVIQVAKEGANRIREGRKRPEWLEKKLEQEKQRGVTGMRCRKWTLEEDLKLSVLFKRGYTRKRMAEILNRTDSAVCHRLARIDPWKMIEECGELFDASEVR